MTELDRATMTRTETDSMGAIEVPADRYWGAQTQRSLHHFAIGDPRAERMPLRDRARHGPAQAGLRARSNLAGGRLDAGIGPLIMRAAEEVASGALDEHFPLYIWQTGSGTQTNMNANEVIANRAIELAGGTLGSKDPVHPNDHVNMGAVVQRHLPDGHARRHRARSSCRRLLPSRRTAARRARRREPREFDDIVKIGRTHLQDAVPLTLGQEFSGYVAQLDADIERLQLVAAGTLWSWPSAARPWAPVSTHRPDSVRR